MDDLLQRAAGNDAWQHGPHRLQRDRAVPHAAPDAAAGDIRLPWQQQRFQAPFPDRPAQFIGVPAGLGREDDDLHVRRRTASGPRAVIARAPSGRVGSTGRRSGEPPGR